MYSGDLVPERELAQLATFHTHVSLLTAAAVYTNTGVPVTAEKTCIELGMKSSLTRLVGTFDCCVNG